MVFDNYFSVFCNGKFVIWLIAASRHVRDFFPIPSVIGRFNFLLDIDMNENENLCKDFILLEHSFNSFLFSNQLEKFNKIDTKISIKFL